MPLLVIVRHGQSQWNVENRFTGETDVPLTDAGRLEAKHAGEKLKGIIFTRAFTSILSRAEETLQIILKEINQTNIPVVYNKSLDERNYGDLQGLNKAETAKKYGDAQVELWRRSYDVQPPNGESLKDTAARVIPYYQTTIEPYLKQNENILIAAHGNSLRALMMHLENISPADITHVEIATGAPRLYNMDASLAIKEAKYL
jgi:2,3-bisphosphoglycerate-dependent phosphoglycerate mutase